MQLVGKANIDSLLFRKNPTVAYYRGFFLNVNTFLRKIPNLFFEGNFMDNIIDKIRMICDEKKIPVSQLEKDLGFGNGYLNPKKIDDIKMGRLFAILDYLGMSRAEFFGEESAEAETEKDIRIREELRSNYAKRMLFDAADGAPESDILESVALLKRRKEEREK